MRKLSCFAIGLIILFNSCVKEKFDSSKLAGSTNFTGIAIPIGYAHMTLQRYFNDSTANKGVMMDANGFITLVYREKVFSLNAQNIFVFQDVSGSDTIFQPGLKKKNSYNAEITDTVFIQIIPQASGIQINSMKLKSGMLSLAIHNDMPVQGTYSITFPGITDSNGTIVQTPIFNFGPDTTISLDLSSHALTLVNHNGQDNFLNAIIDLNLTQGGFTPGSELFGLGFNLRNIQYSVFYGYVGKASIPINKGSFPLNFYQRLLGGNFYFSDPRMKLLFTNSIGVPIEIYFTDIHALTKTGPMFIASIGNGNSVPGSANPKTIQYPSIPYTLAKDSIVLDTTNSTIRAVFDAVPTQMTFSLVDSINPQGTLHSNKNFVLDTSKLEADLQIELPLQGHTDSLLLIQDTLKFEFASFIYKNPKEVNLIYFLLNVTNGFPVEIIPQIYFTDDRGKYLDSLIDMSQPDLMIPAAPIDGNGIVTGTSSNKITVKFPPARIQNIENATHLITRGRIKSSKYPANVKFLNSKNYYLDFNLGVIVQLQVNTSLK